MASRKSAALRYTRPGSEPMNIELPAHGWRPRDYQDPLLRYFDNGGRHACVIWPRRHGKDMTIMNLIAQRMFERVGLYWIMYPMLKQGRKIAWTGMDKMGRSFLSAIPEEAIVGRQNDEMRLEIYNGSVFQVVGADNIDALVGANPIFIGYSEYSLMNERVSDYMDPILEENDGADVYIYTPRGNNHGKKLYEVAKKDPSWYADLKTAADLRVLSPEKLRKARDKIIAKYGDDSLFQQEYMSSFEVSLAGSYYGHLMDAAETEGRITRIPVNPRFPVHTSWDLGVGDAMVIWFWQFYDRQAFCVNCYECTGKGMLHGINYMKQYQDKYGFNYGVHKAPFDIQVREFTSGKARIDVARENGVRFTVVPKHRVEERIEAVRNFMPMVHFDTVNCAHGINGLRSYTKEYDDDLQVYNDTPLHDWASNIADSFGYMAYGMNRSEFERIANRQPNDIFAPQKTIIIPQAFDPRDF